MILNDHFLEKMGVMSGLAHLLTGAHSSSSFHQISFSYCDPWTRCVFTPDIGAYCSWKSSAHRSWRLGGRVVASHVPEGSSSSLQAPVCPCFFLLHIHLSFLTTHLVDCRPQHRMKRQ